MAQLSDGDKPTSIPVSSCRSEDSLEVEPVLCDGFRSKLTPIWIDIYGKQWSSASSFFGCQEYSVFSALDNRKRLMLQLCVLQDGHDFELCTFCNFQMQTNQLVSHLISECYMAPCFLCGDKLVRRADRISHRKSHKEVFERYVVLSIVESALILLLHTVVDQGLYPFMFLHIAISWGVSPLSPLALLTFSTHYSSHSNSVQNFRELRGVPQMRSKHSE